MTLVERILSTLHKIAPDVDPKRVDTVRPLREQVDLDSLDYENLITAISNEYELPISDDDMAHLRSIDDLADYVKQHAHSR